MDDEMKKQLAEYARNFGELAKEQVPLVVRDVINAGIAQHACLAVGMAIAIGLIIYFAPKLYAKAVDSSDDVAPTMIAVFAPCAGVGGLIGLLVNIYWLLVAIYAPRAYLLDWIK